MIWEHIVAGIIPMLANIRNWTKLANCVYTMDGNYFFSC